MKLDRTASSYASSPAAPTPGPAPALALSEANADSAANRPDSMA